MGTEPVDREAADFAELSEEAQADAAPVHQRESYKSRASWGPKGGIGMVGSLSGPVKIKWPHAGAAKEFWIRIRGDAEA